MTIAVLGEAIIDFIPNAAGDYQPHPGGSPYNLAIGLARQNESVCYLSPFSSDLFGGRLLSNLKTETVQTALSRRSSLPTSIALIATNEQGKPSYQLYRDGVADKDTTFTEIEANLPPDIKLMHTGSLAITPSQLPKIRQLLTLMNARSITVSLDINIRLGASSNTEAYLDGVRSLLPLADIVKASDEDLQAFQFGTSPERAAQIAFEEMRSGMLVLTQGDAETVLITADSTFKHVPQPVTNIQDTIGAGDVFYAAFLSFLSKHQLCRLEVVRDPGKYITEEMLQDALAYASAAATINLSRKGCSPPTRIEVETFLTQT